MTVSGEGSSFWGLGRARLFRWESFLVWRQEDVDGDLNHCGCSRGNLRKRLYFLVSFVPDMGQDRCYCVSSKNKAQVLRLTLSFPEQRDSF